MAKSQPSSSASSDSLRDRLAVVRVTVFISLGIHALLLVLPISRNPSIQPSAPTAEVPIELVSLLPSSGSPLAQQPAISPLVSSSPATAPPSVPPSSTATNFVPASRISFASPQPVLRSPLPLSQPLPKSLSPSLPQRSPEPLPESLPEPLPEPLPDSLPDSLSQPLTESISQPLIESIPELSESLPAPISSIQPTTTAQIGAQATYELQTFLTQLDRDGISFGATYSLHEILELFGQIGQAELLLDRNQSPKPELMAYRLIPDQTPEQVWQQVVQPSLMSQGGFQVQRSANYAGGNVYEIRQGKDFVRYFNLVPLNARSGTLFVIWTTLPTQN